MNDTDAVQAAQAPGRLAEIGRVPRLRDLHRDTGQVAPFEAQRFRVQQLGNTFDPRHRRQHAGLPAQQPARQPA